MLKATSPQAYLVALDATGLSRTNLSYYYLKRIDCKNPQKYVKLNVAFVYFRFQQIKVVKTVAILNLITLPLFWLLYTYTLKSGSLFIFVLGGLEALIFWAEGYGLKKYTSIKNPYLNSFLMNIISLVLGAIVAAIINSVI